MRIELISLVWKTRALTIVLYLHLVELPVRIELTSQDYKSSIMTTYTKEALSYFDDAKLSKIFKTTK